MNSVNGLYPNFAPWREEADRLLFRDWFVNLQMAGIDDQLLQVHYGMDQSPSEFVDWFAAKYDLHDFR
jgi:hypothetical protein